MYKIYLYSVGKSKESWLEDALELYQKRLSSQIKLHFIWAKNSNQLVKLLEDKKNILCLDPKGKMMTSEEFSIYLFKSLEQGGSQLHLVIGAALGLPDELKDFPQISLSKMVFTHQMTRLILTEQIYRALAIQQGSPYHLP
jgi:23S rRNA (pseudouridine1915-N3)-methyltransferase